MKKVLFFAAAAMMLSACVMETATPVAGDMETITFEAEASAQTKTTVVDGTKVYWCAGDQISVMGAAAPFTNALEEGETAAKTAFTGEVATADTYYAVYPAAGVTWNGTVATTSLVTTQLPVKGTFANGYNVTVAKTTSQEKAFPFQNVLGHVKFSVKNTVLRSVIVTANGGEIISGSFTVDAASNNPKLVPGTGRSYVQFTEFNVRNISDGEYYIALLPGTYSEGLTFEFENKEGVIATATIDGPVTLEAGHVNNIGSVDGLTWGQKESGNVIWTGKYFVEAWKGCQDLAWGGYDWSKAKAGDILKVYGGPESEGLGWWCICLKTADKDWTILPGTEQYNNPTDLSVTLTQDMIDALVANNGLVLQGQDYVFTKIELVPGTGETEKLDYPVTLWEGEVAISWNPSSAVTALGYGGYDWTKVQPGNALKVEFTTTGNGNIRIGGADGWASLPSFKKVTGYNSEWDNLGVNSRILSVSMPITEEDITVLIEKKGLVVCGDQTTVTKIVLLEEMGEEFEYAEAPDATQNLITNAGFENGVSGWFGFWGAYTYEIADGRNGGSGMLLTLKECANFYDAQLWWSTSIEPGTYVYEFYAKADAALNVQFCGQEPGYSGIYAENIHVITEEWTLYTGDVVYDGTPAGIDKVGIQFGNEDCAGAKLWLDDFSFKLKK